ncbi:MAG: 2-hydroxyacid dehydrogenase [Nostocoides sp.]
MLVSLPDEHWVEAVGPIPGIDVVVDDLATARPHQAQLEVVVPPYMRAWDIDLLHRMPRLRLVQLLTAGYDTVAAHLPTGVELANAAGVHDASTAELALTLTLASLRGLPSFVRDQQSGTWQRPGMLTSLADRRVLIVGYGRVGAAIARRLKPFEVDLTVLAGHPRSGDDLVAHVHGRDDLARLLPSHEVVIVAVPLTEQTRGLIDDHFLSALPDGALVVNVARGAVADTQALVRHAGRVRLALDVTNPEPLPDGHPLWQAPNVLITPHVGGASTAFAPRASALLRGQLTRVGRGLPPEHVVTSGHP